MAKEKKVIRPILKRSIMKRSGPEKVEYLYIPEDFDEKALKKTIRDGGEQFHEVKELIQKNVPQYVVITTDKVEEGLLAVSLLAGVFRKQNEIKEDIDFDCSEYEMEDSSDRCEWIETYDKVPVVSFAEANSYFDRNTNSFSPFQNAFTLGQQLNDDHAPYWMEHRICPICIMTPKSSIQYNPQAANVFKNFNSNEQVYILIYEEKQNWMWDELRSEDECNLNQMILQLTAEEITIPPNRSVSRYYENIWRQMVKEYGFRLSRGFRTVDILADIEKMDKDFSYEKIEQILKYAVRNKRDKVLKAEDFRFMERFVGKKRTKQQSDRSALQRLREELIGLEQVKDQVEETVQVLKFNRMREKFGIKTSGYHNVHLMLGAPGTAKTTVAKLMGKIMEEEQLLPGSQFVCVNGAELKGMYVGHSAPKTKALFDENDIIVIDEAYSLVSNDGEADSFSREAIAQLVIELEEHATDKLVIFAGYGGQDVNEKNNKMKEFIDSNPGIKSRINSTFYFQSYSAAEMAEIFQKHAQMNDYDLEDGWRPFVEAYFSKRVMDTNFGNGREARSLFEKVCVQMAKRLVGTGSDIEKYVIEEKDMRFCKTVDIKNAIKRAENEEYQMAGNKKESRPIGFAPL